MPSAKCSPDAQEVPVGEAQSLLEALLAGGVPLAHACGGKARCSTCRIEVREGLPNCAPRTDDECALARRLALPDQVRLACQTRITGPVSVRRLVLDERDQELASQLAARPAEGTVGHEVRAAVLFADVAGFTTFSERLPAYDVIHVLNRWFRAVNAVVEAEGGRVDNYMGDGVLALFGVDDVPDPALRAVRAALGLQGAAAEMDAYFRRGYGMGFSVRVGVHVGPLVVGWIGTADRPRETAIGDSVNFASRIEAANKQLGTRILVSDDAARDLAGRIPLRACPAVEIKGKAGAHVLHEVLEPGA